MLPFILTTLNYHSTPLFVTFGVNLVSFLYPFLVWVFNLIPLNIINDNSKNMLIETAPFRDFS